MIAGGQTGVATAQQVALILRQVARIPAGDMIQRRMTTGTDDVALATVADFLREEKQIRKRWYYDAGQGKHHKQAYRFVPSCERTKEKSPLAVSIKYFSHKKNI